ncbi:10 TM acyl transferase domain found in Cas1p-domain-containing protein [Calycina marina]|uniref:10 TM acyl transferase domain found in Cas1p-domain-containing protein n=1 Tax=Calycina marina TaxID=1763456 RepID=A0A9P7Z250_9HELO|nr:10 TM acyl transferase domain found in Cas1p-domain-containing protein [Calycina marina]
MWTPKSNAPRPPKVLPLVIEFLMRCLLLYVVGAVIVRFCWINTSDPYKCSALLNRGSWLDPAKSWNSVDDFKNWQPEGCMMHEYNAKDIKDCFQERRMVFVGDSTIRQIYWAVAYKLDPVRAVKEEERAMKHEDSEFTFNAVKLNFVWDPFLNTSKLEHELRYFNGDPSPGVVDNSAGLILAGAPGLWIAQDGTQNYLKDLKESIETVVPFMDHSNVPKSTSVPSRKDAPNLLLLAPVQTPRYQLLSPEKARLITPNKTIEMNEYLRQLSAHSEADILWSYAKMIENGIRQYEDDGIHLVQNVNVRKADILLNLRCNAISAKNGPPFDRTCCSTYARIGATQWMILLLGLLLPVALMMGSHKYTWRIGRLLPSSSVLKALTVFVLVLILCLYADRTQLFEKTQKHFRLDSFRYWCYAIAIIGVVSLRANTSSKHASVTVLEDGFLSRQQTEEWKGWMQAFILAYHYTGASHTKWIYEIVRLLVASYMFMTGYGHTLYFLRKEDYSLKRGAAVLIRLNLLSCALPYITRADYHHYYFAPLVTFWFMVIYFTLKTGHQYNEKTGFLLLKMFISALAVTGFTRIPGILESVAFFLKHTCAITINATDWRFRTVLDMYIVYAGMLLAVMYNLKSQTRKTNKKADVFQKPTRSWFVNDFTLIAALYVLPGFWAFARQFPTREEYNTWHPYISFIPILAYITLRNADFTIRGFHVTLRNHNSTAFAWLGRCSLETYVLQYHVWLAADSKGILRTGVFSSKTDAIILTPMFIWLSWHVAGATQKITTWILHEAVPRNLQTPGLEELELNEVRRAQRSDVLPSSRTHGNRLQFGNGKLGRMLASGVKTLEERLVARLGLLLFMMWMGNVTYW